MYTSNPITERAEAAYLSPLLVKTSVGLHRGEDEDDQNRVFDVPPEEPRRHQAHLRQEEDQRRHLKDQDHPDHHALVEIEGVLEPRHEFDAGRVKRPEEGHRRRKEHVVAEQRAADRAERRQDDEGHREAFLLRCAPARRTRCLGRSFRR